MQGWVKSKEICSQCSHEFWLNDTRVLDDNKAYCFSCAMKYYGNDIEDDDSRIFCDECWKVDPDTETCWATYELNEWPVHICFDCSIDADFIAENIQEKYDEITNDDLIDGLISARALAQASKKDLCGNYQRAKHLLKMMFEAFCDYEEREK